MKSTQSGFVMPLILVIAALLAVGGGVYVYQENAKVEEPTSVMDTDVQTSTQTQETPAQEPPVDSQQNTVDISTVVTSDGVADAGDWKTYQNAKFKMQIAYPPTLEVRESEVDCEAASLLEECPVYLLPRSGYDSVDDVMSFILHHYDPNESNRPDPSEVPPPRGSAAPELPPRDIDTFIYGIHANTIFKADLPPLKPLTIGTFNAFTSTYSYEDSDGKSAVTEFIYVKRDNLVVQFIYNQKSKIDSQDMSALVKEMILTLE